MIDQSNRTFVCSVLFLDIVEYSKQSVADQIKLKQRFNALLSKSLQSVAPSERVILDTGDGAAISFLGSPEEALFVATAVRDASGPDDTTGSNLPVRFGINLGPVRLVKDINGQLNIIGDGINVAQRVMGFSQTGQILASRSYFEVVSRLDEDYASLFQYEGSRTDKHVREHEVYAVGVTNSGLRAAATAAATQTGFGDTLRLGITNTNTATGSGDRIHPKALIGAPLIFIMIVSGGVLLRVYRNAPAAPAPVIVKPVAAPKPAPEPPVAEVKPAPTAVVVAPEVPPAPPEPPPPRKTAAPKHVKPAVEDKPKPKIVQAESAKPAPAPPPPAKPAEAAPPVATVSLAILPWGEVFVDGKSRGISPPLRTLDIPSGKHTIEIRNTSFPSYSQIVDPGPGDHVRIRHKF
jgi:class 3 adenylate cyclase